MEGALNDIMAKILKFASSIDAKVWYIVGAVVALLLIIGFAKKALKVGIILALLWVAITVVPGLISGTLAKHGVDISKEGISISNEDVNFDLDFDSIKSIKALDAIGNTIKLQVVSDAGTKSININRTVYKALKTVVKSMGIDIIGDK